MKQVITIEAKSADHTVKIRAVLTTPKMTAAITNVRERKSLGNVLHQALRVHGFNSEQIDFIKKR